MSTPTSRITQHSFETKIVKAPAVDLNPSAPILSPELEGDIKGIMERLETTLVNFCNAFIKLPVHEMKQQHSAFNMPYHPTENDQAQALKELSPVFQQEDKESLKEFESKFDQFYHILSFDGLRAVMDKVRFMLGEYEISPVIRLYRLDDRTAQGLASQGSLHIACRLELDFASRRSSKLVFTFCTLSLLTCEVKVSAEAEGPQPEEGGSQDNVKSCSTEMTEFQQSVAAFRQTVEDASMVNSSAASNDQAKSPASVPKSTFVQGNASSIPEGSEARVTISTDATNASAASRQQRDVSPYLEAWNWHKHPQIPAVTAGSSTESSSLSMRPGSSADSQNRRRIRRTERIVYGRE